MTGSFRRIVIVLATFFAVLPCLHSASGERKKLAQAMAQGIRKRLVWDDLYNPRQRDQLYEPIDPLQVLPAKDTSLTLFFSRSGELVNGLKDMIKTDVVEELVSEGLEVKWVLDGNAIPDEPIEPDEPEEGATPEEIAEYEEDLATYETELAAFEEDNAAFVAATQGLAADIRRYADMMTFQEHRAGIGIAKEWRCGYWYAAARTWAGVAERNYWMDKEGREGIAGVMQRAFPDMDGKFNPRDFVAMRWGLGDTHLKLGYVMPFAKRFELRVGPRCVLPTGRGIGRATKNKLMPLELDSFKDFARTRLNEVLIEPQLGNNGHYGVGAWADITWNPMRRFDRNKLTIKAYGGVDYLFESGEERLMMHKEQLIVNESDEEITNSTSPNLTTHFETADTDLRSYINQYVLPRPVTIRVAPGIVAQGGVVANFRFDKSAIFVGYDAYYKEAESFERFKNSTDNTEFEMTDKVLRKAKEQYKLLGGFSYTTMGRNVNLFFHRFRRLELSTALHGAASIARKNTGQDFVFGVTFGMRF